MGRTKAPVKPGQHVELVVDRLAHGGRGVARYEEFVLFVARALPGDRVRARVTKTKRSWGEAIATELLEAGPNQIDPPCPYVGTCGGCAWQRLDYPAQLAAKESMVRDALERIGGIENPPVAPIIGADNQYGYRNKVEYTFLEVPNEEAASVDEDDEESSEAPPRVALGFHVAGRWDQLVEVDPCLIADPRGLEVKRIVERWANQYGFEVYDRDDETGLLRNLVVRVGHATGEIMVHVVTGPCGELPRGAELADDLEVEVPGVVSVLHSQTDAKAETTNIVDVPVLLGGREWFEEELAGKRLRVRAHSFLQTNTAMANRLYDLVRDVAQLREDDVAWDLYCGIGSISLMLAEHVEAVVGVEVVEQAIECAKENAQLNGIDNVEFQVGNVRPVLKFAQGVWPDPSLIVIDPPRSGLSPKVIARACGFEPERIVYVSCNPTTFASDMPVFREHGYELVSVQPVDQFPHTHHCELVARLEPVSPQTAPPTE
jgi:23S rRNA (uracil1939-C5)-methyltransferase